MKKKLKQFYDTNLNFYLKHGSEPDGGAADAAAEADARRPVEVHETCVQSTST